MKPSSLMTITRHHITCVIGIAISFCHTPAASASNFTFRGQNPALFPNASPYAMSQLMEGVKKPESTPTMPTISPAELIQQSVIGQISSKIYNDIFNGTAVSGFFDLGNGSSIGYKREGGYIIIDITNPSSGSTSITVLDI